ncbi:MAG: hypothetical protein Q7S07_03705 [Candidatus Omnitrophota bacterium]|nr:hypothetical protein [Candidatus Omnitrophota bacterium]
MGVPLFLFLYYSAAFAQDPVDSKKPKNIHEVTPENANRLRPGMEIRNIGGINMVVPEGTQYYTEGSQLKMEEAGEYAARRFKDSDERFKKLEDRIRKMEKEVQNLQEALNPHKK